MIVHSERRKRRCVILAFRTINHLVAQRPAIRREMKFAWLITGTSRLCQQVAIIGNRILQPAFQIDLW